MKKRAILALSLTLYVSLGYSSVIGGEEGLEIHVTPSSDGTNVIVDFNPSYGFLDNEKVVFTNKSGEVVLSRNLNGKIQGKILVDTSNLESGTYIAFIGDHKTEFVVNH